MTTYRRRIPNRNRFEAVERNPQPSPHRVTRTEPAHLRHRPGDRCYALKAEALIRALYGETHFLLEITQAEQSRHLWAVMETLVDPSSTEPELDHRLNEAHRIGRTWLNEALAHTRIEPVRRR